MGTTGIEGFRVWLSDYGARPPMERHSAHTQPGKGWAQQGVQNDKGKSTALGKPGQILNEYKVTQ